MRNNTIENFKYYTKDGRRISAFAESFGCQMVITMFLCSKEDQFKRSFSWTIWKAHYSMPASEIKKSFGVTLYTSVIQVEKGNEKIAFREYMDNLYCKKVEVLVSMDKIIPAKEAAFYQIIRKMYK